MIETDDMARAAMRGEGPVLAGLAGSLIRPERDNLVERPWGGDGIRRFKRIPADAGPARRFGEAFEISAFDADPEAGRYPSRVRLGDGSIVGLPGLLEAHGEVLLGEAWLRRHGACFPLLPKTLSVKELLSVQGHPAGHTEVYIIIDAEPGATLRLGFSRDLEAAELERDLVGGIARQDELTHALGSSIDAGALQSVLAPWFADRTAGDAALSPWLERSVTSRARRATVLDLAGELKALYWRVLDSMNAIEVRPGQVIYNATPKRLLSGSGALASAEVHALGNPEGREILALEIRRPGPTFRAWDNVRFPKRAVDVGATIAALNLCATRPEEFMRERVPVPGRGGAFVSVDCEFFRVEHLRPARGRPVAVPGGGPHSLHCLAGTVAVIGDGGRALGRLEQGESALVPVGVGDYRVEVADAAEAAAPADVVRVTLPER